MSLVTSKQRDGEYCDLDDKRLGKCSEGKCVDAYPRTSLWLLVGILIIIMVVLFLSIPLCYYFGGYNRTHGTRPVHSPLLPVLLLRH